MPVTAGDLALDAGDLARLEGAGGRAVQLAQEVLGTMAAVQGAARLIDVTRGHIDGCILAHDANLIFAEAMAEMGARVAIPTTINAISVDRQGWRARGVPPVFGNKASRLADAYVRMGVAPTFTCAPYQGVSVPEFGEVIGWSESNAVIYANSVLGARTAKHPDYLDLFIAMTGRAPETGVYLDANRVAQVVIEVEAPEGADDALWPLLGWLAGRLAPDRVPLLRGLAGLRPTPGWTCGRSVPPLAQPRPQRCCMWRGDARGMCRPIPGHRFCGSRERISRRLGRSSIRGLRGWI